MDNKKEIIRIIQTLGKKHDTCTVFSEWITLLALDISNSSAVIKDKVWKNREKEYLEIINHYDRKEQDMILEANKYLVLEVNNGFSDILGDIFQGLNISSRSMGQCFTPFPLSRLCAKMSYHPSEVYNVLEPSIGSGGTIVALASVLADMNIDYHSKMCVVGQDIDWRCVYMSYIQLSLYGIPAVIVQGDSLSEPYVNNYPKERTFCTPVYVLKSLSKTG